MALEGNDRPFNPATEDPRNYDETDEPEATVIDDVELVESAVFVGEFTLTITPRHGDSWIASHEINDLPLTRSTLQNLANAIQRETGIVAVPEPRYEPYSKVEVATARCDAAMERVDETFEEFINRPQFDPPNFITLRVGDDACTPEQVKRAAERMNREGGE